ncbi:MAG: hypothetical protein QOJ85_3397, partial [Solirubrobacteraceae bacterium]|nr:hypothetical protein [Solirubrobacteraceae bacterium]
PAARYHVARFSLRELALQAGTDAAGPAGDESLESSTWANLPRLACVSELADRR